MSASSRVDARSLSPILFDRSSTPPMASRDAKLPSQQQLVFPLLAALDALGGMATPRQATDALAERYGVSPEERAVRVHAGDAHGATNQMERTVRFVRERAKALGFVTSPSRGLWALTEAGRTGLRTAQRGTVITVFTTDRGVVLYANAEDATACLANGAVTLVLTSPPYPLLKKKGYGNEHAAAAHVEWLLSALSAVREKMTDDGTMVLNLGPSWMPGQPTQSIWREELLVRLVRELGFHHLQKFEWHNPAKLPTPAEWVTVRRVRVTDSLETCLALGKTPHPKWDNRRVLQPYSERQRALLARGGEATAMTRPSGHAVAAGAFGRDNGGSIPKSLLTIAHTTSNDAYIRHCKAHDLPVHPARFPGALADFFIKLTTEPGNLVYDPFAGSLTVAERCEDLDRPYLVSEHALTYIAGGGSRLLGAPGFTDHVGLPNLTPRAA